MSRRTPSPIRLALAAIVAAATLAIPTEARAMPGELADSGLPPAQVRVLVGYYRDALAVVRDVVLRPPGGTAASREFRQARAAEQERQIAEAIAALGARVSAWAADDGTFAAAAAEGRERADRQAAAAGVRPTDGPLGGSFGGSFGAIDRGTAEAFARDAVADLRTAAADAGVRAVRVLRQTRQIGLDEAAIDRLLAGGAIAGTPAETARRLRDELRRVHGGRVPVRTRHGGVIEFEAGHYASMVARTKTRQAVEVSRHGRLASLGLDVVVVIGRVSGNFCTAFLGQAFSLSGRHPKYPAVWTLPGGGPPFHPNCTKSTRPFVESLADATSLDVARGVAGADALLTQTPAVAQRRYRDLQIRPAVTAAYGRTTPLARRRGAR